MGWRIEVGSGHYDELRRHLSGEVEEVAFLFTEPYQDDRRLKVLDVMPISVEGFDIQSDYHVELADELRPQLIKRAWDENACLIEAHSHIEGRAAFSPSDLSGFEEWVPHLRWRLRRRPYAALVFAREDFDALVWHGDGPPIGLDAIEIVGGESLRPTDYTIRELMAGARPTEAASHSVVSVPTQVTKKGQTRWWRRLRGR